MASSPAFAAYKEKTSDPTPLFNAQTFARVPLAPDEETRYGLRIKGVMVELDDAVAFQRIARPTKGLPRRRQAQGRAQPGAQKVAAETQGEDVVMGDAVAEQSTTEARQAGDDVLGKGMRRWLAS